MMKLVLRIKSVLLNYLGDIEAPHCIKKQLRQCKQKTHNKVINIGFVAQMPEVWDKQMDLFEYMMHDDRFNPSIIYVKHYDFINKKISDTENTDKQYYIELYGKKYVTDIDEMPEQMISKFDYIFYDRPYNQYLPDVLKSYNVMRKTKICLINYCTCDWDEPLGYRHFARSVYIWFATSAIEKKLHNKEYRRKPYNRVYYVGYPILDRYTKIKNTGRTDRILWTPRWSYDKRIGGSHFLEYIHQFIRFKAENPDISLTIRPHPLMFDNLIAEKLLSCEEVLNIKSECKKYGITFDVNRNVEVTLQETDILISDYSSILRLFLATGRPIIYCPCKNPINEEFSQLVKAMYIADRWDDIQIVLSGLFMGEDCLLERRAECAKKIARENNDSTKRISSVVYDDYYEK